MAARKDGPVLQMSDKQFEELAKHGADPRITATGAAFNALIAKCLGVPCRPLDDTSAKFINDLDEVGRKMAEENGIEIRDK